MSSKQVLMETLAGLFTDPDQGKAALAQIEEAVDGMVGELKEAHEQELKSINEQILEQYGVAAQMLRETEETAYAGYAEAAQMLRETEETAYAGYAEAAQIIEGLEAKIEEAKAEVEAEAYANYEDAAKMIDDLQRKNDTLELDMQEAYEARLRETREDLIDRLDAFLSTKSEQVYDHILDEVTNNPAVAFEANALRRIRDIANETAGDEPVAAPARDEEPEAQPAPEPEAETQLQAEVAELRSSLRAAQAKNTRLSVENTRLIREVREAKDKVFNEIAAADKAARRATESAEVETPEAGDETIMSEETEVVAGKGVIASLDEIQREEFAPLAESGDDNEATPGKSALNENAEISPGLSIKDFRILAGISQSE